jgi:hypothetical protein
MNTINFDDLTINIERERGRKREREREGGIRGEGEEGVYTKKRGREKLDMEMERGSK